MNGLTSRFAAYREGALAQDLIAATIVTVMLIPQSLAYALLAGLPPETGLYASILPLVAYALFGSSRTLAVGPVAVVSLLTAAALSKVVAPGTAEYASAAMALALLSGVVLIAMSVLRLGFLANLLSHPVIVGFIAGSAVLIVLGQLRYVLGIPAHGESAIDLVASLATNVTQTHLPTLAIGGATIVFLFWSRRALPRLLELAGLGPRAAHNVAKAGPVLAVAVSAATVALLDLDRGGVSVVGALPQGVPAFRVPAIDLALWLELLPAAAMISLIGFVESVSVAQTLAARRRERIEPGRELTGLGTANLAAAVSGAFPVTGGFARSVVNYEAGAQTQMAAIYTALGVTLTALFLTPWFYHLPHATLAATIIVAVISLMNVGEMRRIFRYSLSDFAAGAATLLAVLLLGVEPGVATGVVVSILLLLWRTSRPHIAVVGQVPGTEHYRNVKRHDVIVSEEVLSIRVDESLYFANARYLEDALSTLVAQNPRVKHVVLVCTAVNFIDASALESLEAISWRLKAGGVTLHLSEVKGPVMDQLQRSAFLSHLSGSVFLSQHAAMRALDPAIAARTAQNVSNLSEVNR